MMLSAERPVGENVEMAGRLFAVTKDIGTAASCRISAAGKCLKDVNQSLPYFVKLRLPGYSSASMIGSVETGEAMRIAIVVLLLATAAFAQDQLPAACGPKDVNFNVKLDKSQHALSQPAAGKALVYFVQDMGRISCLGPCVTTRVGMDGKWVGANQHNSYFSMAVEPGEHHLCANPQSHFAAGRPIALAHFTAEAGKVYYFRSRAFGNESQWLFDFDPIDGDQADYLIASYPLSVSHPKSKQDDSSD